MKNHLLIPIVFSLVLILPYISYGQQTDSSSAQTQVGNELDSIITTKNFKHGMIKYYMNGKEITYWNFHRCLYSFKSSELQYNRYQSSIKIYKFGRFVSLLGVGGSALALAIYGLKGNTGVILFTVVLITCEPIGIPPLIYGGISKHYHFKKAIRLYNEEILKKHQ